MFRVTLRIVGWSLWWTVLICANAYFFIRNQNIISLMAMVFIFQLSLYSAQITWETIKLKENI